VPRILILHAALGTGHTSAAAALGDAFGRAPGVEARVADTLDYATPVLRRTLKETYRRMSERAPGLYRIFYESSDLPSAEDSLTGTRLLGLLERPFLGRLDTLVEEAAPDAIVCTHPMPAQVLLRGGWSEAPLPPIFLVVTDYMAHSTWLVEGATGYFLPSDLTRAALVARGMPEVKLHVAGIPVKLSIAEPVPMDAARRRRDLPLDGRVVTLFGGGIDSRRARLMIARLLDGRTPGALVVVAGRNRTLLDAIADLADGPRLALRRLGYIDYVDDLVAASDLVITKPGGLIVSEVLARGTPMAIVDPIPGQEEWNADYVAAAGAGIQLRMPEMVPPAVLSLLEEPDRLASLARHARKVGRPRAALDIAGHVLAAIRHPSPGP
jgi:processive 1,2-diacylglycerol beta-glucosyltransferase